MYYLVLLHEPASPPDVAVDHESFVDSLIKRNLILLGGPLQTSSAALTIWAAYVLACESQDEAQVIAASDPLVATGLAVPTVTPWDIVAINTAAIANNLAITPDDPRLSEPT